MHGPDHSVHLALLSFSTWPQQTKLSLSTTIRRSPALSVGHWLTEYAWSRLLKLEPSRLSFKQPPFSSSLHLFPVVYALKLAKLCSLMPVAELCPS